MDTSVTKIPFEATLLATNVSPLFEKKSFCDGDFPLNYGIYLPRDYSNEKKYPLILFFHGAGERGNDNEAQFKIAVSQFFKDPSSPVYECIVVCPQCPAEYKVSC